VLDVDVNSLRGLPGGLGATNPLEEEYEQALREQAGKNMPSQVSKRKHQIDSLYHASKLAELELLRTKATATKNKKRTEGRYGW